MVPTSGRQRSFVTRPQSTSGDAKRPIIGDAIWLGSFRDLRFPLPHRFQYPESEQTTSAVVDPKENVMVKRNTCQVIYWMVARPVYEIRSNSG